MLNSILGNALRLLAALGFLLGAPAGASPLVTGNGFGFAVVAPDRGSATRFYPHPHSFVRADPANPLSEGIATPNFIKALGWGAPGQRAAAPTMSRIRTSSASRAAGRPAPSSCPSGSTARR